MHALHAVRDDATPIAQDELRRFRSLRLAADAMAAECDRSERALISRLDDGERVEEGTLHASVVRSEHREIDENAVRKHLGLDVLEELRTLVEPRPSRSLHVLSLACPVCRPA